MKFSELEQEQWEELKPYLDTCLLPITGMTGTESPLEATKCLEDLRDIMDLVEVPYHGRIVTYPAMHYVDKPEQSIQTINKYCENLKHQGFKFVILITAKMNFKLQVEASDLWISPHENGELPTQQEINMWIRQLWRK